jgi:hypothetical protein
MNLSLYPSAIVALLGFLLVNLSPLHATDATAAPKPKKIPFHGPIVAVDTAAQTITVGATKRVFHVTPTTKITDGPTGAASTLAAAVVGEDSGGSYDKATMNLYSLRLGAKAGSKAATATSATPAAAAPAAAAPAPAPAPAAAPAAATTAPAAAEATTSTKAKKQSASGKVVSVDTTANTIVVHGKADQTFTVASDAKITGAANLAAITAGQHVKISYTKGADGTMTASAITVK